MHRALKTAALAASILAPFACAASQGPALESVGATGSAGMATTTGATTSTTTGTTTTSTSTDVAACTLLDAGGAPYGGSVRLYHLSKSTMSWFEVDTLIAPGPAVPASACTGTQVGSCYYPGPGTAIDESGWFGNLDIVDGPRTLYAQTDAGIAGSAIWEPGDTIDVTTSGGMIAPFSGTLVAPAPLTGLSPAFGTSSIHVPAGADLVISWEPSGTPCTQVLLALETDLPSGPSMFCAVDDAAGTLTAPASLLGNFELGPTVTIERRMLATPVVANADVMLEVADVQYGGTLE